VGNKVGPTGPRSNRTGSAILDRLLQTAGSVQRFSLLILTQQSQQAAIRNINESVQGIKIKWLVHVVVL